VIHAWIVGARGLLGAAVSRAVDRRAGWTAHAPVALPWGSPGLAAEVRTHAAEVIDAAARDGARWAVVWVAGAAVTSSGRGQLDAELDEFGVVLDALADVVRDRGASSAGAVFYSSSAGGVYGGAVGAPFDEDTTPAPLSDYGRFKLAAERRLDRFSRESGVSVVAGRIANLYGPGQKLGKMQGLVSHLAKAQLSPTPAAIFVSLETTRDYIYIDDCAELVLDVVERAERETVERGRIEVVKVLASGDAVTISQLLGHFRLLAKGHPHVMLGSSPAASLQGLDLRLRSVVWSDLDRRARTPLPAGIRATMDDMLRQLQQGPL